MVNVPDIATPRLRHALDLAERSAGRDGQAMRAEHLLLGPLDEGTGDATQVLTRLGVDLAALRDALVGQLTDHGEPRDGERMTAPRQPMRSPSPRRKPASEGIITWVRSTCCSACCATRRARPPGSWYGSASRTSAS